MHTQGGNVRNSTGERAEIQTSLYVDDKETCRHCCFVYFFHI